MFKLKKKVELGRDDLASGSGFMTCIASTRFWTRLQNEKNHSLVGIFLVKWNKKHELVW
jgi:hypothetical protein